jgi:vacuolar-type H+-ATPase subunit D/Vma8
MGSALMDGCTLIFNSLPSGLRTPHISVNRNATTSRVFPMSYTSNHLTELDALAEPLQGTVTKKVKSDAVKQEVDRNEDMIRSALRAINSLAKIPDAEASSAKFKTFLNSVVRTGVLGEKYNAVQHESDTIVASDSMDTS